MKLLQLKKPVRKDIRAVINNERFLNKAAKKSIEDQKKITQKAAKLRIELAR